LLAKKASPLKQDSSGGTVFHHAVEKGHLNVLEAMLEQGVDVYSAIEIADNAGRTPLFEALESTFDADDEEAAMKIQTDLIRILTRKK
jgi:ankyrin repeat protein